MNFSVFACEFCLKFGFFMNFGVLLGKIHTFLQKPEFSPLFLANFVNFYIKKPEFSPQF